MTKITFYDFANFVSFWISIFSIYSISYYFLYEDIYYLFLNVYVVVFQCSYDIFLWHSNSSALHHMFVLLFTSYFVTTEIPVEDCITLVLTILSTEISTLFLVIKIWLEQFQMQQTMVYGVNMVFFLLSFIYTRLYLYTQFVILNPQTYNLNLPFFPYIGLYGLFALNIYWLMVMVKIAFKSLKVTEPSYYTFEFLRFGLSGNYLIVYNLQNENVSYTLSTFILALSSYLYHSTLQMYNYKDVLLQVFFQLAIQINSLLYVFSYLGNMLGHISALYHFLFLSITFFISLDRRYYFSGRNLFFVISCTYFIFYNNYLLDNVYLHLFFLLLITSSLIFYSYRFFLVTEKETLLIPLILDTLVILYYMSDFHDKIAFGVVSYTMLIGIYVKPFYSYNGIFIYLMSFVQTYLLCKKS